MIYTRKVTLLGGPLNGKTVDLITRVGDIARLPVVPALEEGENEDRWLPMTQVPVAQYEVVGLDVAVFVGPGAPVV